MIGTKRPRVDRQRSPVERLRLRVTTVHAIVLGEVVESGADGRVVGTELTFSRSQCALCYLDSLRMLSDSRELGGLLIESGKMRVRQFGGRVAEDLDDDNQRERSEQA